ncbi:MAG: ribosome maturation factor [Sediminibacterium sp.]|nr:ribosome maturation factor [Sediminibacterium sp.]
MGEKNIVNSLLGGRGAVNLEVWYQFPYICHRINQQKGAATAPFSYLGMANEAGFQEIEQMMNGLLAEEPEYFLVSLRIKPTNNIKVFIDGDNGITIEKCVRFNRRLNKLIEEAGMYHEGEFSLELSSPGIDEPLKMHRQYLKNIGRTIEVVFLDDTNKTGKLLAVTEADILVEHTEGKGKKAVTQQLVIPFDNIKSTTVQIKF